MNLKTVTKVLFALATITSYAFISRADVKVNEGNGVNIIMENDAIKLNIAVEGGGRISSLVDKKTNKDWVALWKSPTDDGGLLDDRNVFTAAAYRASVLQPGGKVGSVALSAQDSNGMSMKKTITLRDDSNTIEVDETFSNGTQKDARFMIRNYLLPDGGPLTDNYQYFIPVKDKSLMPLTPANGYFDQLSAPWSSVWNKQSGSGLIAVTPGIGKYYFWQGSKIFPTYEWVYPEVAAGKSISVNYALRLIHDSNPNWDELSKETLKGLRNVRFAKIPGWQNEEERYKITDAERSRGYWLSTGDGSNKRRLPTLRIDVPLNSARSVFIGINALKNLADSELQVKLHNIPTGLLTTAWQVSGKNSIKVLSFNGERKIGVGNGAEGRLWLTLNESTQPVDSKGEIEISIDGQKVLLPIELKVWAINIPDSQPFHLHPYGTLTPMTGGYDITPETLKMTEDMFKALHNIGGDVMDWSVNWTSMFNNIKIANTNQTVNEWRKQYAKGYASKSLSEWPSVDFSYYNPWIKLAKKYGITRMQTYIGFQPRYITTTEEDWMVINLKRYLQEQGFTEFFCKIGDEISPEKIPDYITIAKRARADGWRPFTTVTGLVARTAEHINAINPYLDVWQLNLMTTESFRELTTQPYTLKTETIEIPSSAWQKYTNGGAKSTFTQKVFGNLIATKPSETEYIRVFQNGKELQRIGRGPWGNQKMGAFVAGINDYVYVSPLENTDINTAKITMQYQIRIPSEKGEPLAKIDPTDEVWFYSGNSRSYESTYSDVAASQPLWALAGNYAGYGLYAFYRWNDDVIVFYDKDTQEISFSPAYLGYKDAWSDVQLLAWLRDVKKIPLDKFISESSNAPLRIGYKQREVYRWKQIINLTDPFILNDARRKMLESVMQ